VNTSRRKKRHSLTPKKVEILRFIRQYQLQNLYLPTIRELAEHLQRSITTVFEHCENLRKEGFLLSSGRKVRSLELTKKGIETLDKIDGKIPDDDQYGTDEDGIPFAGSVAAGFPVDSAQFDGRLTLRGEFGRDNIFALEVSGDSMIEDNIFPGDRVICRRPESVQNGDIVVALVDDVEVTLKRFYNNRGKICLQPANKNYKPIFTDNCQVQGVVVGLIRNL
jgi:repressor LexA